MCVCVWGGGGGGAISNATLALPVWPSGKTLGW